MNLNENHDLFAHVANVSRETFARLDVYEALLRKWNTTINLVSRSTLDHVWKRHFLDSAQMLEMSAISKGLWIDLGSGAGFPGLIIAIVAAEKAPGLRVTLVESDARKAAFLSTVARETGVVCDIHNIRAEELSPSGAQVLSARALAPLSRLLALADRHLIAGGTALFPKGANWRAEVEAARRDWAFEATPHPSKTNSDAVVLEIKGVSRA